MATAHDVLSESFRVWEIEDLPDADSLWAVVRAKQVSRSAGENVAIDALPISRGETDKETVAGGIMEAGDVPTRLIAQRLDLRKLAGATEADEAPLRLVIQISNGGASTWTNENQCKIIGTQFAGESAHLSPSWHGGELHLCNIFTQSKDGAWKYSVLVRRGDRSEVTAAAATSR